MLRHARAAKHQMLLLSAQGGVTERAGSTDGYYTVFFNIDPRFAPDFWWPGSRLHVFFRDICGRDLGSSPRGPKYYFLLSSLFSPCQFESVTCTESAVEQQPAHAPPQRACGSPPQFARAACAHSLFGSTE